MRSGERRREGESRSGRYGAQEGGEGEDYCVGCQSQRFFPPSFSSSSSSSSSFQSCLRGKIKEKEEEASCFRERERNEEPLEKMKIKEALESGDHENYFCPNAQRL